MLSIRQRMGICIVASLLLAMPASAQEPKKNEEPKKFDTAVFYAGRLNALTKEKMLRFHGGNDATKAAVARGLAWLAKQQKEDGSWEFDGTYTRDRIAATGMALLPFLAAGETHKNGKKYKQIVDKGLKYLLAKQSKDGNWKWEQPPKDSKMDSPTMYVQAIATLALCEAAGMTGDEKVKEAATKAVNFIIKAQAGDGSWGYSPGIQGDTSIVGWQIQALKSAKLAQIPVPKKVFDQAELFLESVSGDDGSTYGYRTKGSTHTLTAVGLLCRQYMGWSNRNPTLARGVDWMWTKFPPIEKDWNIYYYYYATQVVYFFEGAVWYRDWNRKMRSILLGKQITAKTTGSKAADIGSFPKDDASIGKCCGKLGTTALAVLTLEVYYRHPPLSPRDLDDLLNRKD